MKPLTAICVLVTCAAFTQQAAYAAQNYAEVQRVHFKTEKGLWSKAENWDLKKVPNGFMRAYIPAGSTVTVNSPVKITENILLGSASTNAATLYITRGAKISVSQLALHGTFTNANGVVYMQGGELAVGNDSEMRGMLMVGSESTCSGKALVEISDGNFKGGITIGSVTQGKHTGVLKVIGSKPVITTNPKGRNFLRVNEFGTLEFVLDEKGVATMNYRAGRFVVDKGKIIVDGRQYRGSSRKIALVIADSMENVPAVQAVNFDEDYEVKVFPEISKDGKSESLVLQITKKRN